MFAMDRGNIIQRFTGLFDHHMQVLRGIHQPQRLLAGSTAFHIVQHDFPRLS